MHHKNASNSFKYGWISDFEKSAGSFDQGLSYDTVKKICFFREIMEINTHFHPKLLEKTLLLFFNSKFDPHYAGCRQVYIAQKKAENLNFHVVWSKVPAYGVTGLS